MTLLTLLMLTKGAQVGVKALYGVVAVLVVALLSFFFGTGEPQAELDILRTIDASFITPDGRTIERYSFIEVFTFIFPAFTGIAAGLGLSGDLKEPARAIPRGTLWATVTGIVVYIIVALKFWVSATPEQLASDQLYMESIAIWPRIDSDWIGRSRHFQCAGQCHHRAPERLQALAVDRIFPKGHRAEAQAGAQVRQRACHRIDCHLRHRVHFRLIGRHQRCGRDHLHVLHGDLRRHLPGEPVRAFCGQSELPAHVSVLTGCLSLVGAVTCFYLMFLMNFSYALGSLVIMVAIYSGLSARGARHGGVVPGHAVSAFAANLQLILQRRDSAELDRKDWRPMVLGVSKDTFRRPGAFDMVRWLAHRQGFGTYVHLIEGRLDARTFRSSIRAKQGLADLGNAVKSRVSVSTIVSPSYTSAIAQSVQLPGISGQGNNAILLEYIDEQPQSAQELVTNYDLLAGLQLDLCLLALQLPGFG